MSNDVLETTNGQPSPFFHTTSLTEADSLAILHLKRDSLLPLTLRTAADEGYAEGAVTNTRFGSFPHSTLIGIEWGSQVRASKVDTGSRGRKKKETKEQLGPEGGGGGVPVVAVDDPRTRKKRKSDDDLTASELPAKKLKQGASNGQPPVAARVAVEAGSGFIHVLPPTPETWTASLDHRTQVVYTPDYSYILQRLRVRPGSTIIEAGAGSGSFTHAAARAVFNGYSPSLTNKSKRHGKVYSYEYHEPRVATLCQELSSHGLSNIVHLTHRDVCSSGFALSPEHPPPQADAIFLDLPAPWLALKHLARFTADAPLNPHGPVHLCTFSPCIEQVMSTVSYLRRNAWTEISMCEVQNRRIDVRRERVGLKEEGLRGVNASAATVEEAIDRLREVECKLSDYHSNRAAVEVKGEQKKIQSKAERLEKIKLEAETRKLYMEGNLVQRSEPEVRTHTSYLVFATLPRAWGEEDERGAGEMWGVGEVMGGRDKVAVEGGKKG
ncbi:tRNA (adenine-N(1)-)-methyltransferase catalytic subunit trm61 [Extremus antarcticus]|uniref:tRNA (adenine(58)-N(1))-methyltransferase catalytic subunit TRM61 n=1 Tax=Extremus antarcticus TaxID=702011 RepID=A0AAJ0DM23_9PEZI|nr:tRNA (adenine-N(1)-)-methyltransferase catalytic subunit trm61 [Extremus antarcticus]